MPIELMEKETSDTAEHLPPEAVGPEVNRSSWVVIGRNAAETVELSERPFKALRERIGRDQTGKIVDRDAVLSASTVGDILGVSPATVEKWDRNMRVPSLTPSQYTELLALYDCEPADLQAAEEKIINDVEAAKQARSQFPSETNN